MLNKKVSISFVKFQCLHCSLDKKIYRQGYCYDCFFEIPQAADWIIRPELSKAHLDKEDRDLEYEKRVQLQPHIVYLANSSNVKVGVAYEYRVVRVAPTTGFGYIYAGVKLPEVETKGGEGSGIRGHTTAKQFNQKSGRQILDRNWENLDFSN